MNTHSVGKLLNDQKHRREISKYKDLIATPASGAFVAPARASIVLKAIADTDMGELIATIVGSKTSNIKSKGLSVGEYQTVEGIEALNVVSIANSVEAYIRDDIGELFKVCSDSSNWAISNITPYAFFDVNDITVLKQDSAGSIAVTADEQPIGRITDKSSNNFHATQSVAGSRPLYNAVSSTLGFGACTSKRLKYDFNDDALLWTGPTGVYWICTGDVSSNQYYRTKLTNNQPLPISECFGMVVMNRELTGLELAQVNAYWESFRVGLPLNTDLIMENGDTILTKESEFPYTYNYGEYTYNETDLITFGDGRVISVAEFNYNAEDVTTANRESITITLAEREANAFILDSNSLIFSIPETISNIANIKSIYLLGAVTGSAPRILSNKIQSILLGSPFLNGYLEQTIIHTELFSMVIVETGLHGPFPDISNATNLKHLQCPYNGFDSFNSIAVPFKLESCDLSNNLFPQASIDNILLCFVNAGLTAMDTLYGVAYIDLRGNVAPSATGLSNKAILQSRGWTVDTD